MKPFSTQRLTTGLWPLVTLALALGRGATAAETEFIWLDSKRIDELVKDVGMPRPYVRSITRSAGGTELYLDVATNSGTLVEIICEGGVEMKFFPAKAQKFSDDHQPVCSSTGQTLVFADGSKWELTTDRRFGFSPGRSFLFLYSGLSTPATLSRANAPLKPLVELPRAFMPQRLFARSNHLFVFGRKYEPSPTKSTAWGFVYSLDEAPASLVREINLSRFGGVVDMDPATGVLLVNSKGDMFRTWGLYNTENNTYTPLGPERGFGFFLDGRLCKYLHHRWQSDRGR